MVDDLQSPLCHDLPGSTSLSQQNDQGHCYVVEINCLSLKTASLTFKIHLNNPSGTCMQISLFTVFLSGTNYLWITLCLYKKVNDNFGPRLLQIKLFAPQWWLHKTLFNRGWNWESVDCSDISIWSLHMLWLCAPSAKLYDYMEGTWNTASPFPYLNEKSHESYPS